MTDHVERELRRSFMRSAYRRSHEQVSPITHVVGFWLLMTVAGCLFTAATFLPMWQERQAVLAAKAEALQRIEGLQASLDRLEAMANGLANDPVINEHTAVRDLNFHLPRQEIVPTSPVETVVTRAEVPAPSPRTARPVWLSYVPEKWRCLDAWAKLVSRRDVRLGVLLAAAFLASAALVLFAPPSPRSARGSLMDPSALT